VGFLEWLQIVWLGLTGLAIGSFLNVVIARVPEGQSIVRPRSKCPRCGHMLPWHENIPVFSWLALRARCSNCKLQISMQYPLVELATAVLFLAAFLRFGWNWHLVTALVFITLLIPLIVIDAQKWILPFELTLPGILLGVLLQIPLGWDPVVTALLGTVIGFLSFRAFEILGWFAFRKEAMGAGDKFLVAMVGAFLSWRVLLAIIFLSSLQGAVFGLIRIALTGRAAPPTEPQPTSTTIVVAQIDPTAPAVATANTPIPIELSDPNARAIVPVVIDPSAPNESSARGAVVKTSASSVTLRVDPSAPVFVVDGNSPISTRPNPPLDPIAPAGDPPEPTMSWAFLAPGLSPLKRLALLPWSLFLQPIPDEPTDAGGAEIEWTPGASNLPFGPWIGLAAIEVMLFAPSVRCGCESRAPR
jgi:leader peptidase (prepilin peptidase) / N-methyltransferase